MHLAVRKPSPLMKFRDWLFEHVYRPKWQRWAEARTCQLVKEREEIYKALMRELNEIERAVRGNNNNGHR